MCSRQLLVPILPAASSGMRRISRMLQCRPQSAMLSDTQRCPVYRGRSYLLRFSNRSAEVRCLASGSQWLQRRILRCREGEGSQPAESRNLRFIRGPAQSCCRCGPPSNTVDPGRRNFLRLEKRKCFSAGLAIQPDIGGSKTSRRWTERTHVGRSVNRSCLSWLSWLCSVTRARTDAGTIVAAVLQGSGSGRRWARTARTLGPFHSRCASQEPSAGPARVWHQSGAQPSPDAAEIHSGRLTALAWTTWPQAGTSAAGLPA
jgi:hypothetical protein